VVSLGHRVFLEEVLSHEETLVHEVVEGFIFEGCDLQLAELTLANLMLFSLRCGDVGVGLGALHHGV